MSTRWPELPAHEWADTLETLHLWTQVVGKVRMARGPWLNHSWGVTLYVSARGLSTGPVPYDDETFEVRFDLIEHELVIEKSDGSREVVELRDRSVADFHATVMDGLRRLDMPVRIDPMPSEIRDAIPFQTDTIHATYDPDHARLMWRAWLDSHRVMTAFRAGFVGKASPVHLYWGGFDLAAYRFSGRTAPPHPGSAPNYPQEVNQEAYSHELAGAGFWLGNRERPTPTYFAYAYPEPDGLPRAEVRPDAAGWVEGLGSFALPYEAVRTAGDPDAALSAFLESTHEAAADLADWDRDALELRSPKGAEWWRARSRR